MIKYKNRELQNQQKGSDKWPKELSPLITHKHCRRQVPTKPKQVIKTNP